MSRSNSLISRGYQTGRTGLALVATGGGLMHPRTVAADSQARQPTETCLDMRQIRENDRGR